ncbi:MAG TPA: transposase [Mucilaginibacter sp.]|nr:transposase [Mucilaginibacter sp.]
MSTKYKFRDQQQLYFISFAVVGWIDLFIRNEYKQIMLDSWRYCQANKGLEIYGWCIMTSHIHMIIGTHGESLENIMRGMKKHTSLQLKQCVREHPAESRREWMLALMQEAGKQNSQNTGFQLWQQDNHTIALYDP